MSSLHNCCLGHEKREEMKFFFLNHLHVSVATNKKNTIFLIITVEDQTKLT